MKHTILNSLKIIGIAAVLSVGVSYVYAFTQPSVAPGTAASNIATPIHTGENLQEKKGGIWSKKVIASPISIFKKGIFFPGKNSSLRIGSDDSAGSETFIKGSAGAVSQSLNTAIFGDDNTVPLVIDLHGRTAPQDAIAFNTTASCSVVTRFTNDKAAAFEFKKGENSKANIIARQVKLTSGNPDTNDVLLGDAQGNARWAKATVVNGVVQFTTGSSPVIIGQTCTVPVVDVCPNIEGDQENTPAGMIIDVSGSCVTPAVIVDLCTDIAGTQETVPLGMTKDTPGNTPGNCMTPPPVDVCPNIAGDQEDVPVGYELNAGQCGRWLSYGKPASTTNGQTCRSWIQNKTPGWPYTPIESGKFRTVSRENLGNGLTGGIVNIYPDQCVYGRYSNITLTALNGALLSNFDTIPTQPGNYFGPRSSINGGTPWVIYEFQYFYPQ
jgi:hypothetical protein